MKPRKTSPSLLAMKLEPKEEIMRIFRGLDE
jgi:hypothetical protein